MPEYKIKYFIQMEEIIETDDMLYNVHKDVTQRICTMNKGETENTEVFLHSIEKIKEGEVIETDDSSIPINRKLNKS